MSNKVSHTMESTVETQHILRVLTENQHQFASFLTKRESDMVFNLARVALDGAESVSRSELKLLVEFLVGRLAKTNGLVHCSKERIVSKVMSVLEESLLT